MQAACGLSVWCEDEAGPFQAVPHPGPSWQQQGHPATQPHEYLRGGTTKILTLFHPATGQVRRQPAQRCTKAVLHPWLRERLTAILAELPVPVAVRDPAVTRAAWKMWQTGLTRPFTLPEELPPLRLLLVWDNLTGHKTPDLVLWLCAHGIMPLYTPVGGSWLNMAESIQRVLKQRALAGQHPTSPAEIGRWFEQTTLLECAADAVCVERQAPAAATAFSEGPDPPARRLRRLHAPAAPSTQVKGGRRMPGHMADDPLVR
jgi:DDE superfamily endonuclease